MRNEATCDLVGRCAEGGGTAPWGEFTERYGARLAAGVRRALRRCGTWATPEEREDLLQEVYCRLLERNGQRLRRCRGTAERSVGAYLSRIAESVVVDQLRAAAAVKRGAGKLVEASAPGLAERVVDVAPDPEERLLARERRRVVLSRCRRAIGSRTPRRDLRVLYLAFFEGWSSREISASLDGALTPSSVDSLLHRLKRRLARAGFRVPRR